MARLSLDMAEVARKAAPRAKALARERVPVRTGHLRSTIDIQGTALVASARYAAIVEYGAAARPARPYFYNSIEDAIRETAPGEAEEAAIDAVVGMVAGEE